MIVFQDSNTGELFKINYHNIPKEIWRSGKKNKALKLESVYSNQASFAIST